MSLYCGPADYESRRIHLIERGQAMFAQESPAKLPHTQQRVTENFGGEKMVGPHGLEPWT